MSCCGNKRQQIHQATTTHQAELARPANAVVRPVNQFTYFEYTGTRGLTVLGPITGIQYRFTGPGTRVAVDIRDRASMLAVPNLRPIGW